MKTEDFLVGGVGALLTALALLVFTRIGGHLAVFISLGSGVASVVIWRGAAFYGEMYGVLPSKGKNKGRE